MLRFIFILVQIVNISSDSGSSVSWNGWSEWSNCSSTCGSGFMNRTRTCVAPNTYFCNTLELKNCSSNKDCKGLSQHASIVTTLVYEQTTIASTLKPPQSVPLQTEDLNNYIVGDQLFLLNINSKEPDSVLSFLSNLYDEFLMSFEVYLNKTESVGNILLLADSSGEPCLQVDSFLDDLKVTLFSLVPENFKLKNTWSLINISLQYTNNRYTINILVDGNVLYSNEEIKPQVYFNLTLFACPVACQPFAIKNLNIYSRTKVFWSQWSDWSSCNELCIATRTRNCSNNPLLNCSGNNTEEKSCDNLCQGIWSQWSHWSKCIKSCGMSRMNRSRICNTKRNCSGNNTETLPCISNETCVGVWTQWSNWSECIQSCGMSLMNRSRVCDTKSNFYNCSGNSTETLPCFSNTICVALWAQWSIWSECMPSCGKSVMTRERICNGTNCSGNSTERLGCFSNLTCMEEWAMWSACSATCGDGNKTSYELNNADKRVEYCKVIDCPVNGMWSSWTNSKCSTTCGGGIITYSRVCNNPAPTYHGYNCIGIGNYTEECQEAIICPVNGHWSSWSSWSFCNQPCDGGVMSRFRNCSNPAPQYCGFNCYGISTETVNCSWKACKKVELNLRVYFLDEEYKEVYVRLKSAPSFELKEKIRKAIFNRYKSSKRIVNFSVELNSIKNVP